jgi:predicted HTH domain antitoxin
LNTRTLEIPYPEDLPKALGATPEEFERELRFLVSAKLYEMGRISSGRAAELIGIDRVEFLEDLGRYRISVLNYSLEELEQEIREARARTR